MLKEPGCWGPERPVGVLPPGSQPQLWWCAQNCLISDRLHRCRRTLEQKQMWPWGDKEGVDVTGGAVGHLGLRDPKATLSAVYMRNRVFPPECR